MLPCTGGRSANSALFGVESPDALPNDDPPWVVSSNYF